MVSDFLKLCDRIGCPVSLDKTAWAEKRMIFLGILLDGERRCLVIPTEKLHKAINQLTNLTCKPNRKATVKELQSLTGLLNFLNHAIVPGRVFTRSMFFTDSNS